MTHHDSGTAAAPQPLEGLRVLDFSRVLAGPLCTQYLGDMGADVVKVEAIGAGDDSRGWPVFRSTDTARRFGAPFLSANRNKRSLAIDLKSPEGIEACLKLADQADVVVESFGPGVAARLGIDAQTLRARNPKLIVCCISGYGSIGPMREGKGYDVILQAFTGMLSITGEPGGPPMRSPFSPVDQATGLHALIGILAALHARQQTGVGQTIEASLFDTSAAFLGYFLQSYWERGTEPVKPGAGHEALCPYDVFQAQDGPIILGVANDKLWRTFCRLAGLEAIMDLPEFATNAQRVVNRATTVAHVSAVLKTRPRDRWIRDLDDAGIPCSPVHTLGEFSAHEHTSASGMVFGYQHPELGAMKGVSQPIRFEGERTALRRPPPKPGQHSREVLAEIGYSDARIEQLRHQGVIGD